MANKMTKLKSVISFFICITIFFILCADRAFAFDFISPLISNNNIDKSNKDRTSNFSLPTSTSALPPPISFGDLLNEYISASPSGFFDSITIASEGAEFKTITQSPTPTIINKAEQIKNLLSRLEDYTKQPFEEYKNNNSALATDRQHMTYNIEQTTVNIKQTTDNNNPAIDDINISPAPAFNLQPTINIGEIDQNPLKKDSYIIAFLGDSMTDTLGPGMPQINNLLKQNFPDLKFTVINYGQGSTDLESGMSRLTNTSTYLGKSYAPLLSFKPDIIIVESFAYNHWSSQMSDLNRQWLTYAKIKDTVKEKSPETKIIFAATIAPNARIFGDGKLNWPQNLKWESANTTKAYLQNMINFAKSENFPLADAYTPSLDADGNGLVKYINAGDHLHPSDEGKLFFSQKVLEAIKSYNLIPKVQ
jgi:hypothetical protein